MEDVQGDAQETSWMHRSYSERDRNAIIHQTDEQAQSIHK
jgi:hypothetical protein